MRFGFAGAGFVSESRSVSDQRLVNFYPEIVPNGRNDIALYRTPGLSHFITGLNGKCRGMLALNDHIFAVMGGHLYDIISSGATTDLGAVADDGLPVSMAANTDQLFLISAGLGYVVFGGVLTQIVAAGFPVGAKIAGYIDGYFIAMSIDGIYSQLSWSGINDGFSWDALDFLRVAASANALVSMIVANQQILLFGNQKTIPFEDSGGDPPFTPIGGAAIDQGCAAMFSPALLDNATFFLGSDQRGSAVIWKLQGFTPVRVSNHDIENAMQHYSRIDDAIGYSFQMNGHQFYQITFPTAGATWRYDTTTNMWHEALYWNAVAGQYVAHLSEHHCFAFGKHIVGDRTTGTLYEMNTTFLDDDGTLIHRLRRAPHFFDAENNYKIFYKTFELVLAPGIGLGVASGVVGYNPTVALRWSNDGGYTWSNEYSKSAGLQGQYSKRLIWRRLGGARSSRVWEASCSDPVDWCWIDAVVDVQRGTS